MHEIKCQVNISNLSSSEEMMNRIWINSRNVNGVGGTCTGLWKCWNSIRWRKRGRVFQGKSSEIIQYTYFGKRSLPWWGGRWEKKRERGKTKYNKKLTASVKVVYWKQQTHLDYKMYSDGILQIKQKDVDLMKQETVKVLNYCLI